MPTTPNQITGGGFQTILGDPIAGGYLELVLSDDCIANTTTQICAGTTITVKLDTNGDIVTSPPALIWPNDALSPPTSYYTVRAYNANGQIVWGPNAQRILQSPSPYSLGAWIPGETDL